MMRWRRERGVPPPTSPRCPHNRSKEPTGTCVCHPPQRRHRAPCPEPLPRHPKGRATHPHLPLSATRGRHPSEQAPAWSDLAVDSHSHPPPPTPAATRPSDGAEQAGHHHPYRAESSLLPRIGTSSARSPPSPSPAPRTCPAATSGGGEGRRMGEGRPVAGARVSPPGRLEGRLEGVSRGDLDSM
jgi:hypothetical protein